MPIEIKEVKIKISVFENSDEKKEMMSMLQNELNNIKEEILIECREIVEENFNTQNER